MFLFFDTPHTSKHIHEPKYTFLGSNISVLKFHMVDLDQCGHYYRDRLPTSLLEAFQVRIIVGSRVYSH